jgi:hypothetical protein
MGPPSSTSLDTSAGSANSNESNSSGLTIINEEIREQERSYEDEIQEEKSCDNGTSDQAISPAGDTSESASAEFLCSSLNLTTVEVTNEVSTESTIEASTESVIEVSTEPLIESTVGVAIEPEVAVEPEEPVEPEVAVEPEEPVEPEGAVEPEEPVEPEVEQVEPEVEVPRDQQPSSSSALVAVGDDKENEQPVQESLTLVMSAEVQQRIWQHPTNDGGVIFSMKLSRQEKDELRRRGHLPLTE